MEYEDTETVQFLLRETEMANFPIQTTELYEEIKQQPSSEFESSVHFAQHFTLYFQ